MSTDMKFTILGFSQKKLIEFSLGIDEALILRYFIDFKDSNRMVKEYMDDDMYYWINYEKMMKALPILNISKDRAYRKLKNLVTVDVLKHKTKKSGGTFSFYAVGNKYCELIMESSEITDPTVNIPYPYGENNGTPTVNIPYPYGENNGTKYSSIKDSSVNNTSIKNINTETIDYQHVIDLYNQLCIKLPKVKLLSSSRKSSLKTIFNKFPDINTYKELFNKANASNFLTGSNKEGWNANFDWIIKESNMVKVLEGNYDNKKGTPKSNDNFNAYEQRNYDFDDLEKKLLGWDNDKTQQG